MSQLNDIFPSHDGTIPLSSRASPAGQRSLRKGFQVSDLLLAPFHESPRQFRPPKFVAHRSIKPPALPPPMGQLPRAPPADVDLARAPVPPPAYFDPTAADQRWHTSSPRDYMLDTKKLSRPVSRSSGGSASMSLPVEWLRPLEPPPSAASSLAPTPRSPRSPGGFRAYMQQRRGKTFEGTGMAALVNTAGSSTASSPRPGDPANSCRGPSFRRDSKEDVSPSRHMSVKVSFDQQPEQEPISPPGSVDGSPANRRPLVGEEPVDESAAEDIAAAVEAPDEPELTRPLPPARPPPPKAPPDDEISLHKATAPDKRVKAPKPFTGHRRNSFSRKLIRSDRSPMTKRPLTPGQMLRGFGVIPSDAPPPTPPSPRSGTRPTNPVRIGRPDRELQSPGRVLQPPRSPRLPAQSIRPDSRGDRMWTRAPPSTPNELSAKPPLTLQRILFGGVVVDLVAACTQLVREISQRCTVAAREESWPCVDVSVVFGTHMLPLPMRVMACSAATRMGDIELGARLKASLKDGLDDWALTELVVRLGYPSSEEPVNVDPEQQRLDAEYASRRAAEMALIEYAERRGTEIEWRDERHVPQFYP